MADTKELAQQLNSFVKSEASASWPGITLLEVVDGSGQWTDGYVWCSLAGQTVRCFVPGGIDISAGSQILSAIPAGNGTTDYYAIGVSWNGLDNSRIPRMRAAAITDLEGDPVSGGGAGTVTSVALSAAPASVFGISGSPVTGSGTLALTMDNQNANIVLAGPSTGGAAEPAFRSLVAADIPDISATYATKTYADTRVVTDTEGTYGETLAARDRVYLASDAKWYKVDTNATGGVKLSTTRGFAVDAGNADATGTIRLSGALGGFSGLTAGAFVYSSTTAGGYTQTKPAVTDGGGQIAVDLAGQATSTTEILIRPHVVEYCKRATVANNATITIEHHADANTMTRGVLASVLTAEAGASQTSYSETNQDVGVPLRGPSGAGGTATITATGTDAPVGYQSGNQSWNAQSMTTITAGRLSQITFTLRANTGSPTGTMTWEIRTNNTTVPSSTILQTGTLTPTASSVNTITVTNGVFLAGSTTYWLVLHSTNSQSATNAWNWDAQNASDADGNRAYSTNGGSAWTADTYDLACTITTAAVSVGDKLSQSFQVTGDQSIGSIQLYLKKAASPTGTMTLRVETNNSGDPSGTLVDANATTTLAESTLTTSYGWITFTYSTAFTCTGSTTYHVVLSTDRSTDATNYVLWGADASSPGYTSGDMRSCVTSTWSAESKDAIFDVLGATTYYQEPCVMGRVSGGTRDCAVRYDDGAAADPTTKTTFKNTTGGSVDMTCIVRLQ